MKIHTFFVSILMVIALCGAWTQLFPSSHFVQSNCVVGKMTLASGQVNIVDCSICLSFPTDASQKGSIEIRNGLLYEPQEDQPKDQLQFFANVFMQEDCAEYECSDLAKGNNFLDYSLQEKAGLKLVQKISRKTNMFWDFSLDYDNFISYQESQYSILVSVCNHLLGPMLPEPLQLARRYYSGMAIKIRYSQAQSQKDNNLEKPIVKISHSEESSSDYLLVSMLIVFTLVEKLKIFTTEPNKSFCLLLFGMNFVNPPLFSLISLVLMIQNNLAFFVSMLIYMVGLVFDLHLFILISVILCSILELVTGRSSVSIEYLILFNFTVLISLLCGVDSIVQTAPTLFWALCFQQNDIFYSKIGSSSRDAMRVMDENEQLST